MTGPYGNRFIIAIAIVVVLAVVLTLHDMGWM